MKKNALIIDDEPGHRLMVRAVLEDAGWRVEEAGSGEEGLSLVRQAPGHYRAALVDMRMPGMDGLETLNALRKLDDSLSVIVLTAYGTVGSAVEAIKQGAYDYLSKPVDNDELVLTLERACALSALQAENERLQEELAGERCRSEIVGSSPAVRRMHEFIKQAGPSEATVLILGESGTGKELIARGLHHCSPRRKQPFIVVNCAALPHELLESELFGYEKGAFTGAFKKKPGRFQLADGGTLFLDEIGELPLVLQAKFLRVLQDKLVEPLGALQPKAVNVRILAATNRNLHELVASGSFREDLFFRLSVLECTAAPLRERLEDLPALTNHFLGILAQREQKTVRSLSPHFLQCLHRYHWPGNVRELQNVLERALILSRSDELQADLLPAHLREAKPSPLPQSEERPAPNQAGREKTGPSLEKHAASGRGSGNCASGQFFFLDELERRNLMDALEFHQGHREKTAASLGISRRTLQYKLKKYGLSRK